MTDPLKGLTLASLFDDSPGSLTTLPTEVNFYNPTIRAVGPSTAKLMIVGEAPGKEEEKTGLPFMGAAGQELTNMLQETGLERREIYLTNVLFSRPEDNKIETFCVKKKETGAGYRLPPMSQGKYLHPSLLPELIRLESEIAAVRPNLILGMGNTALWALLGVSKISQMRGSIALHHTGIKVLPTYHPSAVLRNWPIRPIVLQDLLKAKREKEFPEFRRPQRFVLINPSLSEIYDWISTHVPSAPYLGVDIETRSGQITTIGFAVSRTHAMAIPLVALNKAGQGYSYWQTKEEEVTVWKVIRWLLKQTIPKIFQNGMYDLAYLVRYGFEVACCEEDTMLLHHALYPELPKGLGFLGSIYTNEASWKLMRPRGEEALKREE